MAGGTQNAQETAGRPWKETRPVLAGGYGFCVRERNGRRCRRRMIGDLAYDSDPLDDRLRQRGVKLFAPHKCNRRGLHRYCRRWKIERLFAWLHNFRRLVIRWGYHEANFLGMLQLSCVLIVMRNYLWDGFYMSAILPPNGPSTVRAPVARRTVAFRLLSLPDPALNRNTGNRQLESEQVLFL